MKLPTQWRQKAGILVATAMLPLLGAAARRPATEPTRLLYSYASGLCLQTIGVANPYQNNLPIVQQPCTGETIQLWYVRYIRNGTMPGGGLRKLYQIVNALTGQCLDDRDGITTNGAYVQQYTCNTTSTTMLWDVGTMTSLGDGRASLKNARSGKCLDIPWASTQPGVAIWQWQCTSTIYSPNYAQIFDVWPPV